MLRKSVERHLVADVPVGGAVPEPGDRFVDHRALRGRVGLSASDLVVCLGFEAPDFDESEHAAEAAGTFGTRHVRATLARNEFEPLAREIAERIDEPQSDSSLIPTFLLVPDGALNVTVALGGDGADELFCGYDTFRAVRLARLYAKFVPHPVHEAVRLAAALLPTWYGYMSFEFRLRRLFGGLSHGPESSGPRLARAADPAELAECFLEPVEPERVYSEAIDLWDRCGSEDPMDRTTQFYVKLYLQDGILAKIDRAGMWNSLEVRSPFLDIELVDFIRRLRRR